MFHSNYLCNLFLSVRYHKKAFTTPAKLLLSSDSIYIFVYENGGPSSLCCGRSKIWCDKYIQSKINKHLNKLVFYLETKGI